MADLAQTLAVTVAELGTLTEALPVLLGTDHPNLSVLTGAVTDAATGLFAATRSAVGGDADTARCEARTQLRALRALQQLTAELAPAPAQPDILDEALDLVCGLLEMTPGVTAP